MKLKGILLIIVDEMADNIGIRRHPGAFRVQAVIQVVTRGLTMA